MKTNNIEKEILLTFELFRHYIIQHMFGWSRFRRLFMVISYPLLLTCAFFLLKGFNTQDELVLLIVLITVLAMGFIVVLLLTIRFLLLRKRFNSNRLIQESYNYKIGNNGLSVKGESCSSEIGWDKVYRVRESPLIFGIYISRSQAFIIPKKIFSIEEIDVLKVIFQNNMTKKQLYLK